MKHIKHLEKFIDEDIPYAYYSNDEIIEFFQMFLDEHVLTHKVYDTAVTGLYYMEFNKIFNKSSVGYQEIENAQGYSDPDLILDKLLFLKDLTPIKKRLKNAGYIFNFVFEMDFSDFNDASINIVLHGSHNSLKDNNYYV